MTETLATYQVDSIPVNQLPDRYGIGRTQFYERRDRLGLKFESRGNRAYATADQIDQLDALHDHVKKGNTIESFVESLPKESSSLATPENGVTAALLTLASAMQQSVPLAQQQSDPLAHLRALQEASDRGWLLASRDLAPLLRLSKLRGRTIRRFGFVCTRVGRWWKITREDV